MVYQNAGRQIQLLRIQHRLTQKELAEKINSSQNYISEVETGKKQPSIDYYVAVANFFNVSLDHLFSDSIKMKKNIIIDNVVLKMSYMSEDDQKLILSIVENIDTYIKQK